MIDEHPLRLSDLDVRMRQAVEELQQTIAEHYPTTVFELDRNPENPQSVFLVAITDADDPDDVGDLVVDRVVDFIANQDIPVHVIPLPTPERAQAIHAAERQRALTGPLPDARSIANSPE